MRARQKQSTTISVRLSEDEERVVRQMARRQRSSVSDVIRTAVSRLVESTEGKPSRPYDEIADLIGSVEGLPPDLSTNGGERFAEILREKARKRK